MRRIVFAAIEVLLFTALAISQDEELEKLPGYVDFSSMEVFKTGETTVEVFLKEPLLSLVANASRTEDPDLAKLLSSLKLIRVQTFSIDSLRTPEIKTKVSQIAKKLRKDKWEIIVRAQEPDEQVHIYMKSVKAKIAGLVIMAISYGEEAAFVNIVGDLDLENLGKLSRKFDIPALDSLKTPPKQKPKEEKK